MKILIKVLKGEECEVEVFDTTTIFELKRKVEKILNIPAAHQKVLYLGRTLVDCKTIGSYSTTIKPGSKLTVVVKEGEQLKDVMLKMFKRYYPEAQAVKMNHTFMTEFERKLSEMSLDDIERMATYFLNRDRQLYGETTQPI
ncbi:Ubiquitin-like protein 4A [Pseudolycoriella hygida]|uniref:Ubiquitin-like protein 4A n=1 Tax=Pseudolycoriella hygida TaxID=35572 RepID=A0A9Q0MQZ2_9DIPT|nr:Ubiquitin-like protein 4A [Pseudolycoriella hygida]